MPPLSPASWRRLGWLARYLIAARAPVLSLTLFAALFGGLLALPWPAEEGLRLLLASMALLFAHAASNLLNDQVEWALGTQAETSIRLRHGAHPLAQGWLHPVSHAVALMLTGAAAVALALVVCRRAGTPAYWIAGAGTLLLVLYPWPLKRLGLGEPAVFLVWGPLIAGGVYWVVSGDWGPEILVLTSLFGLGPAMATLGEHLDARRDDATRGVSTLAVKLGPVHGPALMGSLAVAQMSGFLLLAWLTGAWSYLVLLVALPAFARLLAVSLRPRPGARPAGVPSGAWSCWYSAAAFRFARASSGALVAAALLDGTLAAKL